MVTRSIDALLKGRYVTGTAALALMGAALTPASAIAQMTESDTPVTRDTSVEVAPVEIAEEDGPKVSGLLTLDYNSHFISYGFDVWGAGTEFFGDESTFNPSLTLTFDFDTFTFSAGSWWDVNDNVDSAIGGEIQEQDVYYTLATSIDKFTPSITYQHWHYAGGTEQVLDLALAYDDSGMYGDFLGQDDFALNPSILIHKRLASSNIAGDTNGFAFLIKAAPSFGIVESETQPVSMTVPVTLAFGTDDFYPDSGYAFFSIGAQFSTPLTFIDSTYGEWALNAGITAYNTDVNNPDDDFITGNIGVSMAF